MDVSNVDLPGDDSWLLTCCQRACPVGTDVSAYLALIAESRFAEALAIVREENPFPGTCGRVCDHPCEALCRRTESDQPVAIRALKRFLADYERGRPASRPERIEPSRPEKVAVIGAGPAGLTAASDLVRRGFHVTVLEALPKAGGMMRVGIPDYRLPPDVLDFDLEYLRQLGVEITLNTSLGRDVTLSQLKAQGCGAVLLATGAHGSRPLTIKGADLPGVLDGIDFLRRVKLGDVPQLGGRVVVIGGGDVAMDTARTALRLGAKEVKLFCLESREQMPAHDWEMREALDEQIEFHCSCGPVEMLGDGRVRGVRFVRCTNVLDESGAFAPQFDTSESLTVDAEAVLPAIGQIATFGHEPADGVGVTDRRLYAVDPQTLQASAPWIFAAGDAAYGTATVIKAVAAGHQAATSICEYLEGRPLSGRWRPVRHPERIARAEVPPTWEDLSAAEEPELPARQRAGSFSEVKLGLTEAAATAEAGRCMRCDHETKSYTYSRKIREQIYRAARDIGGDQAATVDFLRTKLSDRRQRPHTDRRPALFDDLVFLPANLTRLVIDPYREDCNTATTIGRRADKPLKLAGPVLIGGVRFSELDERTVAALCTGAKQAQIALRAGTDVGPLSDDLQVIRTVPLGGPATSIGAAAAVELIPPDVGAALDTAAVRSAADACRSTAPGAPIGIAVGPENVAANVQASVEAGLDFVTLHAIRPSAAPGCEGGVELNGIPHIGVLDEAVRTLWDTGKGEEIDLIYFGFIRGGGDAAKALALGAKAAMIGQAAIIAAAACGEDRDVEQRGQCICRLVQAISMEASILARSCGKTDVQNLEPEDLRALSVATSRATSVPLVGAEKVYAPDGAGP